MNKNKPTHSCPKHGYPLYRKTDPCPICREEVEDEYGESLDDSYFEDDEGRDDRNSGDGDCMDCGMCEDCIERTIAANEEDA